MFGFKGLSDSNLSTAFMVVSAMMFIFGLALAPANGAATATAVIWIVGALALVGLWIAVAVELARRFFGGGNSRQPEE